MTQVVMTARAVLGGEPTVRDRKLLLRVVAEPAMAAGDIEEYPTVSEKAAALLVAIAYRWRPFGDGNKRTGFAAALLLLALNQYRLDLDPVDAADLIDRASKGAADPSALAPTIAAHLTTY
ncbi:MAG: Fic family protein [Actinocatenispora sp.]